MPARSPRKAGGPAGPPDTRRPADGAAADRGVSAGAVAAGGGGAAGHSAATYRARQMLARAHWAAGAFAAYDRASVLCIAEAVATAAHAEARRYAGWAVSETGFGGVAPKIAKNEACPAGILDRYRDDDY